MLKSTISAYFTTMIAFLAGLAYLTTIQFVEVLLSEAMPWMRMVALILAGIK